MQKTLRYQTICAGNLNEEKHCNESILVSMQEHYVPQKKNQSSIIYRKFHSYPYEYLF